MVILASLPLFGSIFSTTSKPDRLRKSIGPISSVLKRQQPFSTSYARAHPQVNAKPDPHQYSQKTNGPSPELITESSILSAYPRPNLMPTLHFSLFGGSKSPEERAKKCSNCAGPHSTDFCPC